uniref:Uncharacterized protein n=1 Tax=candidate division WOR-3 bacterium TaxID=2052148 RepID=A0A7C4U9E2_UNCW3
MGNSLPVRTIFLILIFISCTKTGNIFERGDVYTKVFNIDSTYSYFTETSHSSSPFIYTGERDSFKTKSLIQFTAPDTIDSIYLFLIGDEVNDTIFFFTLKDSFKEDSITYSMVNSLKNYLYFKNYYNNDTILLKITPPYDSVKNGLIIESNNFYKFCSKENSPYSFVVLFEKARKDTLKFTKDAYVCYHPFLNDTTDTLFLSSGVSGRIDFFIPRDSLNLDSLFSRFDISLKVSSTCTLSVNIKLREKVFKTIGTGRVDTTGYISIISGVKDLRSLKDTMENLKFTLFLKNESYNPRMIKIDSLKVLLMYVEDKE